LHDYVCANIDKTISGSPRDIERAIQVVKLDEAGYYRATVIVGRIIWFRTKFIGDIDSIMAEGWFWEYYLTLIRIAGMIDVPADKNTVYKYVDAKYIVAHQ